MVLVSGSGSNLQAIIDAVEAGEIQAEIAAVISNKQRAFGLERAKNAGIPAVYFPFSPFKERGRKAYDQALAEQVADFQPDLIVLAGWMRIFTPSFLDQFADRIINLHPALPGTYIGAHGVDWAWESFQAGKISQTGCMVHMVTADLDEGPVVATAEIELFAEDTKEDFVGRLRTAEHQLIVAGIQKVLALGV